MKRRTNRQRPIGELLAEPSYASDAVLSDKLDDIETEIRKIFDKCADLVVRRLMVSADVPVMVVYLKALIDEGMWEQGLLMPLMNLEIENTQDPVPFFARFKATLPSSNPPKNTSNMQEAVRLIVHGGIVLFFESRKQALSFHIDDQLQRQLEEPMTEAVIRGPRVGFIEKITVNMTLLRQLIRTPRLKLERMTVGTITDTEIVVAYIENLAPPAVIEKVKKRLSAISLDSVMGTGYLEEMICDTPYTPFPLIKTTERPDAVAGSLIEGKVAVFVNGTPMVMIMPITFWYGFQSVEDYYLNFIVASMLRWLRFLFALFAFTMPSIYVAITTFHQEMIPTSLALSLAAAREIVPFPAMVETLIMEATFEALREAGVRLPRAVGQTISIVGALVIGQAAVQAGIISAPIIIVVSLTGIASFLIPQTAMSQAISLFRFPLVLCAGMFGLYGMSAGLIAMLIHLASLHSLGMPYLWPIAPFNRKGTLDVLFRAPWRFLHKRQQYLLQKRELENP
ncbi:spore germination protein [Cohnella sp.]|uniref:spore germination protein n=1 Tax=Cohnella sp. TaxID=1883426 RepID=UPI003568A646